MPTTQEQLLSVAITELPNAIAWIKAAFLNKHPGAADPSDAEVIAAFEGAFQSSIVKDETWLAAHPLP